MYVTSVDIDLTKGMVNNMTRKIYSMIPVLAAIAIIPQLLFWWLAPTSASSHLAVYIAGTVLTISIPLVDFIVYCNSNIRKTFSVLVVSGVLQAVTVILSALLLWLNVSIRSTVFAFLIATLVYLMVLVPMIISALGSQREGVAPIDDVEERVVPSTETVCRQSGEESEVRNTGVARMPERASNSRPLPPRNR